MQPETLQDLTDEVMLTIAGIHILQKHFIDKKACWTLVVNKAMNAVIKAVQQQGKTLASNNVQEMVDSMQVDFSMFRTK